MTNMEERMEVTLEATVNENASRLEGSLTFSDGTQTSTVLQGE